MLIWTSNQVFTPYLKRTLQMMQTKFLIWLCAIFRCVQLKSRRKMKLAALALPTPSRHTHTTHPTCRACLLAALACLPRAKKPVKTVETMLIQTTLYSSYTRCSVHLHYMTHMKVFYKTLYKTAKKTTYLIRCLFFDLMYFRCTIHRIQSTYCHSMKLNSMLNLTFLKE